MIVKELLQRLNKYETVKFSETALLELERRDEDTAFLTAFEQALPQEGDVIIGIMANAARTPATTTEWWLLIDRDLFRIRMKVGTRDGGGTIPGVTVTTHPVSKIIALQFSATYRGYFSEKGQRVALETAQIECVMLQHDPFVIAGERAQAVACLELYQALQALRSRLATE